MMHYFTFLNQGYKKILLLIPCLFVLISVASAAAPENGQWLDKKISLLQVSHSLEELIRQLEEQHVPLVYDAQELKLKTYKITAKRFEKESLRNILHYHFRQTGISYREMEGFILLEKEGAQQTGRLTGRVLNDRGRPLANATVRIMGINQRTQTTIDGNYAFQVPVGRYNIQFSYLSYQTQQVSDVQIKAGQLTRLDIAMKESSSAIKEVLVRTTFKKASVAGLYAAQKNAATVTDGISAEQIAHTPDNNIGQVLNRITGITTMDNRNVIVRGMSDRYNQAQLDGVTLPSTSQNRRDFAFNIIPAEMVSSVVVNKTASPDKSSEFSGGQVSVNTLDIPDENFNSFQIGSGMNSQALGKDFNRLGTRHQSEYLGFYDKSAKYPSEVQPWIWHNQSIRNFLIPLGEKTDPSVKDLMLNFDLSDRKYGSVDAIEQSKKFKSDALVPTKYKGAVNRNLRFSMGRRYHLKNDNTFGFAVSASIRNEENVVQFNNVRGSLTYTGEPNSPRWMDSVGFGQNGAGVSNRFNSNSGLVGNLGLQGNKYKIAIRNMYARTYSDLYNESYRLSYRDPGPKPGLQQYQLPEAMSLQQHQITAEYLMPWEIRLESMFALNKIKMEILDERKLQYYYSTTIGGKDYYQSPNILSHARWSNMVVDMDSRMWSQTDQMDYNWAVSLAKDWDMGDWSRNMIKVGYQGWQKDRSLWVSRMLPVTRAYDINDPNLASPAPIIRLPYYKLFQDANIGTGNSQAIYYPELIGGNIFDGDMKSHAAYIMLDQKLFNFIRLHYGVRMEYYNLSNRQEGALIRRYGESGAADPKWEHLKYVGEKDFRWLPSVNATFSITKDFNVRASYSKTAIRPDFRESSSFGFYDAELDAAISGERVVSTIVDNADVRLEWYPNPGEIISLTGFLKYLDKPIELVTKDIRDDVFVFANMHAARNLGIEFEVRKNFGFISDKPFFSKFFVHGNYTWLKSTVFVLSPWQFETSESGETIRVQKRMPKQDRPLLGQAPWVINLGLGYWGDQFGVTTSYNHRGFRTFLTAGSPNSGQFELAPRQIDAQVYARFLKNRLEAKLNMANLLNDWTRYYRNDALTSTRDMAEREQYNYKREDGDVILFQRREGRRYGLTLTYNF